ncbi:MAG: serine hydrolase domain-containing protein [Steroidobacteraceae bacterium]
MPHNRACFAALLVLLGACTTGVSPGANAPPARSRIDAEVARMMRDTGAQGFALALVDHGRVSWSATYGARNAAGAPLEAGSILYAASLTKTTFAYLVLQLVEAGRIELDRPLASYLPKPLPDYAGEDIEDRYARWSDLAGDDRWRTLTTRMLLNHASGFANFGFLEPDGKLRFHFDPGTRFAYSGDGIILLQFVLEQGLGLDVGHELQTRLFEPLQLRDTSLVWRADFAGRVADGWTLDGSVEPHDERSKVRAAGSMDTTIGDMARLVAAIARGELLGPKMRKEMVRPQLPITTRSQFPTLQDAARPEDQKQHLAAGIGVVTFEGPQGRGFFKGGHNESTGNMVVCLEIPQRCVVMLGNDLRAEAAIPYLVEFILGPTGLPWDWEYGDATRWRPASP